MRAPSAGQGTLATRTGGAVVAPESPRPATRPAPGRPGDRTRQKASERSARSTSAAESRRHERIRNQERTLLGIGLVASVAVHFGLFVWTPSFHTADLGTSNEAMESIQLPPDVKIPPPPKAVARPATPRVAEAEVSPELTIAPTTLEANPASALPPPPPGAKMNPEDRPTFIPYDVAPRLLNRGEIEKLVVRYYPPALRAAGIGGTVLVWAYVDENGNVTRTLVKASSGYQDMDAAAMRVVDAMRFKPALNRDARIGVWISQKISMNVQS
ncbi:MAG TPA: energy transducer TonB [Gemmatimonadota bacterium]|nr:energy transducer TonB [Gemmatimonadota bacterium]